MKHLYCKTGLFLIKTFRKDGRNDSRFHSSSVEKVSSPFKDTGKDI